MDIFLSHINADSKLSPEHHISLFLFNKEINKDIVGYKYFIATEDLINQFNDYVNDDVNKQNMENILKNYKDKIDIFLEKFKKTPWLYAKPIVWNDRPKDDYYIRKLTSSHRFELYMERIFSIKKIDLGLFYKKDEQYRLGESAIGVEIKNDIVAYEGSPNLYIEYQERLDGEKGSWVDSGILKVDNSKYFLIGYAGCFWVFEKSTLVDLYNQLKSSKYGKLVNGCKFVKEETRGTSKGFILPKVLANKICVPFDNVINDLKLRKV